MTLWKEKCNCYLRHHIHSLMRIKIDIPQIKRFDRAKLLFGKEGVQSAAIRGETVPAARDTMNVITAIDMLIIKQHGAKATQEMAAIFHKSGLITI